MVGKRERNHAPNSVEYAVSNRSLETPDPSSEIKVFIVALLLGGSNEAGVNRCGGGTCTSVDNLISFPFGDYVLPAVRPVPQSSRHFHFLYYAAGGASGAAGSAGAGGGAGGATWNPSAMPIFMKS